MTDDGSDVDSELNSLEHNYKPAGPARQYLFNWFHNSNDFADNLPWSADQWVDDKGTQCYCWWINRGINAKTVIPAGTPVYSNSRLMYDMYASKFNLVVNGHTYTIKPWGYDSNGAHIECEYDGDGSAFPSGIDITGGGSYTWNDIVLTHLPNADNMVQITSAYDMQVFNAMDGFSVGVTLSASYNPGWFVINRGPYGNEYYWV